MKRKNRQRTALLWMQGAIVFFMGVVFAGGFVAYTKLAKIEAQVAAGPSVVDMDHKLFARIGTTYDLKLHRQIIGIMGSNDDAIRDLTGTTRKMFQAIFQFAGFTVFLALFSIFLILRSPKEAVTPPQRGPEETR